MSFDAIANESWAPPAMPEWAASQPLFALQRPPPAMPTGRRETGRHQHPQGQILYVERGMAQVLIDGGTWLLPPHRQARQRRLMMVLLDELRNASKEAFHLPMPTDRRLLRIARAILAQPGQARTLDEWSDWAGVSARTVNRLFRTQVGMSFMAWRQEAMLMHATSSLARGESVSNVADALGYSSPSNFIAMFRRSYGESPTRYLTRTGEYA